MFSRGIYGGESRGTYMAVPTYVAHTDTVVSLGTPKLGLRWVKGDGVRRGAIKHLNYSPIQ